jgi:hypothetical protein
MEPAGGRLSTERPDELADQEYAARLIRSGARRESLARLKMEVTQDSQAV